MWLDTLMVCKRRIAMVCKYFWLLHGKFNLKKMNNARDNANCQTALIIIGRVVQWINGSDNSSSNKFRDRDDCDSDRDRDRDTETP